MKKILKLNLLLVLAVVFLAGCAREQSRQVAGAVDTDFTNAHDAFEMSRSPKAKVSTDTVSTSDGVWLGSSSMVLEHKNDLPREFETDTGLTIMLGEPVTLQVLANNLYSITGIPVKIDGQVSSDKLQRTMGISYTGAMSGLLNQIATDLDLLWYYDKNNIVFYETETKTFTLYALGTDVSYQSSISSEDGNQVSLESNMREWEEVEKALESIIGGDAKYNVSRSLGTITVTAPPSVLARVDEYINKQNRRLSQLITIDVKVLQVSISNASAFGLDLGAAINQANGLTLTAKPTGNLGLTDSSSLSVAVLAQNAMGASNGKLSSIEGSNALITALARQGKVSLVTNVGVTTRNNRIAPVSNTKTTGYIKRFESRNFTTVESSTVDQENLETGFSMQLLPNVMDNGRVLLMFRMSIRELINMRSETIGGSTTSPGVTLQLPEVEERSFMQEVIMESGQILVLSGFERQSNNDTRYGMGDPDFMALSGSRNTTGQRDVLVVMLTPQILVSPMDAEKNIQQNWGAPLN
ncbi:MAG: hypothetical protein LBL75_01700 [Rickettsiales bacterium]|jgi:type II secretory pathway component GspD/PulD (secretin)|nr:hypothetical protein [Rickettsiales bacterium]